MNTGGDPEGLVRHGNERVLRARFNDARFFWDVDQQKKLADRVDDLANVTFQAKLGSYLREDRARGRTGEGTRRRRARPTRGAALQSAISPPTWSRSSPICKASSAACTRARRANPRQCRSAIYDHYKPVSMEDSIPSHARRADRRAGRQAGHAARLLPRRPDPHRLEGSVRAAPRGAGRREDPGGRRASITNSTALAQGELHAFLLDRIHYYFREIRGFKYDEVNAVLAAGLRRPGRRRSAPDCASQRSGPRQNFEPLAASFKRIQNILKQAEFRADGVSLDEALLEAGPGARSLRRISARIARRSRLSKRWRHRGAASQGRPVLRQGAGERAGSERVAQNRLTLLHNLLDRIFHDRGLFGNRHLRRANNHEEVRLSLRRRHGRRRRQDERCARRQGRRPGRDEPRRRAGASRLHHFDRGLQHLLREQEQGSRRDRRADARTRSRSSKSRSARSSATPRIRCWSACAPARSSPCPA